MAIEFVNPKKVLSQLNLQPEMTAADFGCGSGGWVLPLAEILKDGKVFAVDIQETAISALESKIKMQGASNIVKILADVEQKIPGLKDLACDLVLITDLLFQVEDRAAVFSEAARVLKRGGKILLVEWSDKSEIGPKENKVSSGEAASIAERFGLKQEKDFKAGDYHYGLVFVKN